ncbi:hypothetical protein BRADI_1g37343v3 [Brachypodium distachyon]|uniref:Uncharacterized protein n=1 Tax=Brachypodium distachyon TaxID=15368 RepID=A0A0Q3L417_BRADI|nr:hypothetical protein BRADI_1g37343v3 [Brachypodium distachyon]
MSVPSTAMGSATRVQTPVSHGLPRLLLRTQVKPMSRPWRTPPRHASPPRSSPPVSPRSAPPLSYWPVGSATGSPPAGPAVAALDQYVPGRSSNLVGPATSSSIAVGSRSPRAVMSGSFQHPLISGSPVGPVKAQP